VIITEPNTILECSPKSKPTAEILKNVQSIKFKDPSNTILYFPKMAEYFKEIRHIYIHHAGLIKITHEDLAHYPLLYRLNVENNKIESLEASLFAQNSNLEVVNMNLNKINTIHETTFNNSKLLKTLKLFKNVCIDEGSYENTNETRILINFTKLKCSQSYKELENSQAEVEALQHTVYISLAFNCLQVFIMFAAVAGFIFFTIQKSKSNQENSKSTAVYVVENNYQAPNDIYGGSVHDYAEPYRTPVKTTTMNKSGEVL
jgi:Leucine-rich repeat (LRR) protein